MKTPLNKFRNNPTMDILSKEEQKQVVGGRLDGSITCFYEVSDAQGNTLYASGDGACAGTHSQCMGYAAAAGQSMANMLGGNLRYGCNNG